MVRFNDCRILYTNPMSEESVRDFVEDMYNLTLPMGYFIIKKIEGESWERVYRIKEAGKYKLIFQQNEDFGGITGEIMMYVT